MINKNVKNMKKIIIMKIKRKRDLGLDRNPELEGLETGQVEGLEKSLQGIEPGVEADPEIGLGPGLGQEKNILTEKEVAIVGRHLMKDQNTTKEKETKIAMNLKGPFPMAGKDL